MKKTYISPKAEAIKVNNEELLTLSGTEATIQSEATEGDAGWTIQAKEGLDITDLDISGTETPKLDFGE